MIEALDAGRAAAEARMVDSCTIKRKTGSGINPTTGAREDTFSTVYSGKCEVQLRDSLGVEATAGDRELIVVRFVLKIPMAATSPDGSTYQPAVSDIATLTASSLDPALLGRNFRVRELFHKTFATARRLVVEEAQS